MQCTQILQNLDEFNVPMLTHPLGTDDVYIYIYIYTRYTCTYMHIYVERERDTYIDI